MTNPNDKPEGDEQVDALATLDTTYNLTDLPSEDFNEREPTVVTKLLQRFDDRLAESRDTLDRVDKIAAKARRVGRGRKDTPRRVRAQVRDSVRAMKAASGE